MSAQTFSGEVWKDGPGRATLTPADGRRGGVGVFGAFEPASGLATTLGRPWRHRASVMPRWELVLQTSPAREWGLIRDHLSPHVPRETPAA